MCPFNFQTSLHSPALDPLVKPKHLEVFIQDFTPVTGTSCSSLKSHKKRLTEIMNAQITQMCFTFPRYIVLI